MVHPLEMGVKNGRLEADPDKFVKEYSRSAAGRHDPGPCDLRPTPVLNLTIDYLLQQVSEVESRPWNEVYDFIFDRLRAVRQDMVIQNLNGIDSSTILEKTIRFLIYSGYRLCEESIEVYDSTINNQHVQECLKRLLYVYSEEGERVWPNRVEFECLYLMFNLGQTEALMHYYDLPEALRKNHLIHLCYLANIHFMLGNFVRVLQMIGSSPIVKHPLLLCAAHRHIAGIQRKALEIFSHGYNSKSLKYPVHKLVDLLWIRDEDTCVALCGDCGLTVQQGDQVVFHKQSYHPPDKLQMHHLDGIECELKRTNLGTLLTSGIQEIAEDNVNENNKKKKDEPSVD